MIPIKKEPDGLLKTINQLYPIEADNITLHRNMIGHVYFIEGKADRYVLKIYRPSFTKEALQSIRVLDYLKENGYPCVSIIPTKDGEKSFLTDTPEGQCVGIVYNYIKGEEPDGKAETQSLGVQIGMLHNVMERYPQPIAHLPYETYIGDYLSIMKQLEYTPSKIDDLKQYGEELWERINKLPKSFCHGDIHTGNMLRVQSGEYILFDFDDASGDFPAMDVAYMSDDTNFNRFNTLAYDKTMRLFERFYSGYSKVRTLSDREIQSIFDFIAVRHYQIIARIVKCQGLQSVGFSFFDEQYDWLMNWRNLCEKKMASFR